MSGVLREHHPQIDMPANTWVKLRAILRDPESGVLHHRTLPVGLNKCYRAKCKILNRLFPAIKDVREYLKHNNNSKIRNNDLKLFNAVFFNHESSKSE